MKDYLSKDYGDRKTNNKDYGSTDDVNFSKRYGSIKHNYGSYDENRSIPDFKNFDIINNRYKVLKTLGTGISSIVVLCEDLVSSQKRAIKILKSSQSKANQKLSEVQLIFKLRHKFLPIIIDCFRIDDYDFIVTPYEKMLTLENYCLEGNATDMTAPSIFKTIFLNLLEVVAYIHKEGVIHLDIKPDNILVDIKTLDIKLIDFGVARSLDSSIDKSVYPYLSIYALHSYAAPEVREQNADLIDIRADIYSLGTLLYFLSHNFTKPPFVLRASELNEFKKVIVNCTQVHPLNRYNCVADLRADFLRNKNSNNLKE